ncbi:MAG: MMPL family transporter, partial [Campylobacterota bacterium]|nr:MMPL family transporter [Campylobacterota bacterium]
RGETALFLGGANMIADDMISFVKYDLRTYGTMVLLLLIFFMWLVFRQWRFILIPIMILLLSVVATTGFLGLFGWEVTVVSSNFISLQMIITMSLIIHLIVRYRELLQTRPDAPHREIVLEAAVSMFKPCFYVVITTIAGFSSLVACDILPVINLGWMMSAGVAISLAIAFLVFPAVMMLLKKRPPDIFFESRFVLTKRLGRWTERFGKTILAVSAAVLLFSISGAALLIVENSFIDYFKKSTEIYQGMKVIDRQLGGTTPLDIIIDFPQESSELPASSDTDEEADEFDDFEAEFESIEHEEQYWFTSGKMNEIEKIHDYLDALPEVGKVLSFATTLKVGREINQGKDLDNLDLALFYNELPEQYKKILLQPYLSLENNQARFTLRIIDSMKDLRRDELLKRIKRELHEKVGVPAENIRLASMMVMYNNMLQSLFNSQIMTLGIVLVILSTMFLILFRSLKIALIATVANVIPVGGVLGFMGWAGIPLDMMTITIAAISLGIAVDDTIHYLHRFKIEVAKDGDYIAAMHRSHASIGYAMYYTSVAIMIGFSVLVLSNFVPTIYFGLLTMLAMFMAIVADLLLLPKLILLIRPFR